MLLTSMDIDASDEAEFNRWYDREHLEERVAIDGFLEARRYVAHAANPKYLSLYSTETFDVLDSPAYRTALANQTDWSKANIARFKNMIRAVARITVSRGQGRGAALGIVRLRPPADGQDKLRSALQNASDRERSGAFQAHIRRSPGVGSRCRRLVCPDRWDACERGFGCPRRPHWNQRRVQIRRDFNRRLQSDVGPGEERSFRGLNHHKTAHAALPHKYAVMLLSWPFNK